MKFHVDYMQLNGMWAGRYSEEVSGQGKIHNIFPQRFPPYFLEKVLSSLSR